MAVTIKDVASLSGVSLATASRVLNAKPGVKADTRERVLSIAKELNYLPNQVAASMKTKRTNTIGLVVADITNPFYAEIAKTIEMRARECDYTVIIGNTDNRRVLQEEIVSNLSQKRVDGFIFASVEFADQSTTRLIRSGLPCIMYHRRLDNPQSHFVGTDDGHGIGLAVEHLCALGHEKIAYISGSRLLSTGRDRFEAFLTRCRDAGLPYRDEYIKEGGYNRLKTAAATEELIALPDPPTAIIAANDLMALQVLDRLCASGYRVPEDFSVVGFDNVPMAAHSMIRLTSVDAKAGESARMAIDSLLNILDGVIPNNEPLDQRIKPELIIRSTTGAPRRGRLGKPETGGIL